MTDLDIWNNLILDHFFNINRSRKLVRLNVTKELIEDLGAKRGWKFNNYLDALKNGSCYVLQTNENPNICEYASNLYDFSIDEERWPLAFKNNPRPPYVAYLGFFVYLTTLQNADNNSYHRRLWNHFPLNNTNNPPNFYPDFNKMVILWNELEDWSKKENFGVFSITKLGTLEHISIPKSQAILTDKEKNDLPHFFASANLNKNSKMDTNRWKQAIRDNPKSFMNRTLEALDHDRLSDYLITDLEDALKNWDGTIPNPAKQNLILQNSTQTSNVSKVVLFFDNFRGDLIPRIRFFSDSPECLEIVKYFNNYQTLYVTPKDGWSNCLQTIVNKNNVRFDASSISWTTPFELKTDNSNTPSELRFESRHIRVFVSANRLSLSGYFEVDKLPSSGGCLIAFHNDKNNEINDWFNEAGLSPILKNNAKLPGGWKLLDLNNIPTNQNIRNNFPGESENPDVIFEFIGGLKYKKQGRVSSNKYYSNFPPCVELHGEYREWVLTCNDKTLEVNAEGIAKLPENLGTGKFIIKIIKNNEFQEKPIELLNVYHAGDPLRIHKHMDKFGFPEENTTGFSGGWLSDLTASNYEWSCKTQNNQIVSRNGIQWGISAEFLTPDLIQDASDCKNYPVQYFYDLCKLNSDAPIEDRNVSGERVSKFHEQNGLFPPEQGLPLSRLLPINNINERSIHSTPSNRGHTHSFLLPDVKVFKEHVTFLMQVNAERDGCFLKLKSHPANDQFPECIGIYSSPAPFNTKSPQNLGILKQGKTEKYDTSYELMTDESWWSVNKVRWDNNRWVYNQECCIVEKLIITPWQINDLFKHLDVYNSLLNYGKNGKNISCPNEITIPNNLETVLTEQNELADLHKRVIKSPPSIQKVLSIKGAAQSEILECPEYEDMPTSVKLAWILAWIDRRVAWEGRSILNKIKVEDQLALRKSILIAFKIDHPWANLFTKCLAISEYVLTILRKKGLGKKINFGETSDSSGEEN